MANIRCMFDSRVLGKKNGMNVLLPETGAKDCSVLYLLHGNGDTYEAWCDRSEIEALAERYNLVVVMPDAAKSFYLNMDEGPRYYDHVAEEVPELVNRMFGVENNPKRTHIAGLSMGGYGAFMIALRNPDRFCTAGSFSGCLDLYSRFCENVSGREEYRKAVSDFDRIPGTHADLLTLLKTVKEPPMLYQFCGTEDFLYQHNLCFFEIAKKNGVAVDYHEGPGGHEWELWREQIKCYVPWMLEKENAR